MHELWGEQPRGTNLDGGSVRGITPTKKTHISTEVLIPPDLSMQSVVKCVRVSFRLFFGDT